MDTIAQAANHRPQPGNPLPSASEETTRVTQEAAAFVAQLRYEDLPEEATRIAQRCITDTVGLYAAGLSEESVQIVCAMAVEQGGRADALALGAGQTRVPAPAAARILGISAHAHDFDDTQISKDPAHVYGLLTHPSAAPLSAALTIADMTGGSDGRAFATAFLAGFEVSCKVSEWMLPDHYLRGHHSSGTVATFGAAMSAGKLLGLSRDQLAHALAIAAAMAAGVRCSFGTMCKPWHVGRASENGVVAALMAQRGFKGDPDALDGRWGFASVLAGGWSAEKLADGFGNTWSIIDPSVSIKPYPSGILTHQAMDMVLGLVEREDIRPDQVDRIDFHAGDNILNPIRYPVAKDALQAKFSMAALISMLVLYRRAGLDQFDDEAVRSAPFQEMQQRVNCHRDADINAMGFDLIRSRVDVALKGGRMISAEGDTRYRGGPNMPMTDAQLESKLRSCCEKITAPDDVTNDLAAASNAVFDSTGPLRLLDAIRALPEIR